MATDILGRIKRRIGIVDEVQDDLLKDIIDDSNDRILSYVNQDGQSLTTLPVGCDWIVTDVAVKLYNRIGDEGKMSSGEGDVSNSWADIDISEYATYLDSYRKDSYRKRPGMRFV